MVLDKPGTSQKGVYIALLSLHTPAWHLKILFLIGNTPSKGLFSIAMLVYHRVMDFMFHPIKNALFLKQWARFTKDRLTPRIGRVDMIGKPVVSPAGIQPFAEFCILKNWYFQTPSIWIFMDIQDFFYPLGQNTLILACWTVKYSWCFGIGIHSFVWPSKNSVCSKNIWEAQIGEHIPSLELTYPIPRHFWTWFSFSPGGIC